MSFLQDESEIIYGLKTITDHYGYPNYDLNRRRGLEHVLVGNIVLDEITWKRNLPVDQQSTKKE